ncbi:MAG: glycoside hydrolase family 43 protein [Phycisphaerales bacterium]|nr:MAG: glycoside hydrolase family 43 protein [Phycisphaerales bacterium]
MRHASLTLVLITAASVLSQADQPTVPYKPRYVAYLMAYFGPEEKLFYAVSRNARTWTALNNEKPVFDAKARLRDPFINRAAGRFHLVHTKGWDHPVIFHWDSADLVHWTGGPIKVVDDAKKRAWAPEFFYSASEGIFYVFWASIHDGHNTIHYVTTKDWTDITPARSAVYYDIGIHDIDLTIVRHKGIYYGFHKPGGVEDQMGNRLSTATSLDPKLDSFADAGYGRDVLADQTRPTEGPEVIRLIGEDKWYVYGDPFRSPLEAWETADFIHYKKIPVSTPKGAKHCSVIQITQAELENLLAHYGPQEHLSGDGK